MARRTTPPTRLVIVGCGYAADFYLACCTVRPDLIVAGAYDTDPERLARFTRHHGVRAFGSLAETLAADADIVVNATSLASHYPVTRAALLAGRHVFSEKPVALELGQARELWDLADRSGLLLVSAPSTMLGPCAAAVRRVLESGAVGRPRLVHASLDDGAVHLMNHGAWRSPSGNPWPAAEEFAAGPILEHLGYQLTWLVDLFGGVRELAGATGLLAPAGLSATALGPNSAHWTLTHESGVVCRLSGSGLAPRDYSLTIVGDAGVITVDDVMRLDSRVTCRRTGTADPAARIGYLGPPEEVDYHVPPPPYADTHYIDFAAGVADLADAMRHGRPPVMDRAFGLHVLELTLAMARVRSGTVRTETEVPERRGVVCPETEAPDRHAAEEPAP